MQSLTAQFFRDVVSWYLDYAQSFCSTDTTRSYHILLKRNHSLRVAGVSGLIARKSGLSESEILLARLIGLLHDVARFEQYSRYRTFRDAVSFDHGEYGANLLDELGVLAGLDNSLGRTVQSALRNHNKKKIPAELEDNTLLHTRLIRDADKLDIVHLTCRSIRDSSSYMPTIVPNRNGSLSRAVIEAIARREPIDYGLLATENDFHLLKIGWVYDLNFPASLAILHRRGHLDVLKGVLPVEPGLVEQLDTVDAYLSKRLTAFS